MDLLHISADHAQPSTTDLPAIMAANALSMLSLVHVSLKTNMNNLNLHSTTVAAAQGVTLGHDRSIAKNDRKEGLKFAAFGDRSIGKNDSTCVVGPAAWLFETGQQRAHSSAELRTALPAALSSHCSTPRLGLIHWQECWQKCESHASKTLGLGFGLRVFKDEMAA